MKTAFVTGATAGFGLAICRVLIQAGYRVIGSGRRKSRLDEINAAWQIPMVLLG